MTDQTKTEAVLTFFLNENMVPTLTQFTFEHKGVYTVHHSDNTVTHQRDHWDDFEHITLDQLNETIKNSRIVYSSHVKEGKRVWESGTSPEWNWF